MIPYVRSIVPDDILAFFLDVSRVVEALGEVVLPEGEELSCHMLVRAISARMHNKKKSSIRLRAETGLFNGRFSHSWLVVASVKKPEGGEWILDPYPVAGMAGINAGALLRERWVVRNLYEHRESVNSEILTQPHFRRCVRATSNEVSNVKKALGL